MFVLRVISVYSFPITITTLPNIPKTTNYNVLYWLPPREIIWTSPIFFDCEQWLFMVQIKSKTITIHSYIIISKNLKRQEHVTLINRKKLFVDYCFVCSKEQNVGCFLYVYKCLKTKLLYLSVVCFKQRQMQEFRCQVLLPRYLKTVPFFAVTIFCISFHLN